MRRTGMSEKPDDSSIDIQYTKRILHYTEPELSLHVQAAEPPDSL